METYEEKAMKGRLPKSMLLLSLLLSRCCSLFISLSLFSPCCSWLLVAGRGWGPRSRMRKRHDPLRFRFANSFGSCVAP